MPLMQCSLRSLRSVRVRETGIFKRYASSLTGSSARNHVEMERQVIDTLSSLAEPVTSLPLGTVGMIQSTVVQPTSSSSSFPPFSDVVGVKISIDVLVPGYTALNELQLSCMSALKSIEWIDAENCKIHIVQRLTI